MSKARSARLIAVLGAIFGALGTANSALAAESCVYDPVSRTVTASISANGQATLVGDGGVPNQLKFGQVPTACGGATTGRHGLDQHRRQRRHASSGSSSMSGAASSSPAHRQEFNIPEIEFTTTLGDAGGHDLHLLPDGGR